MNYWDKKDENEEQEFQDQAGDQVPETFDESFEETFYPESSEEDDDFEDPALMEDAKLRLEQGTLYNLLLDHDLFGETDADPRAVANVQREVRKFVRERLKVMLGMKPDPRLSQPQMVDSPFSNLEVDVLKRMVSKFTKGVSDQVTESPRTQAVAPKPKPAPTLKPLQTKPNSAVRVNPNRPTPPPRQQQVQRQPQQAPVAQQRPVPPIHTPDPRNPFANGMMTPDGTWIPPEDEMPLASMTQKEAKAYKRERNKRISERQAQRTVRNPNKAPIPSPNEEASIMTNLANQRQAQGALAGDNSSGNAAIVSRLSQLKINE